MDLNQPELLGWRTNSKFPLLFNNLDNGKIRVWACWVIGNVMYRTDGLVDGKIKTPTEHVYTGNTLKTPEEQALAEAEKKWIQQLSKGYIPKDDNGLAIYNFVNEQKSLNGGMLRGVKMWGDTAITTGTTSGKKDLTIQHFPMLAKKYKDYNKEGDFVISIQGQNIKFPAIAQAKVDGLRALPRLTKNDKVMLESRNGKDYVHLNNLRNAIKEVLEKSGNKDIILDGEMYIHKLYKTSDGVFSKTKLVKSVELKGVERFQFLSETCKITRKVPHQYEDLVEFWVFDIWDNTNLSNFERWKKLEKIFKKEFNGIVKLVPTRIVNSHEEIEEFMKELVGELNNRNGYEFEGLMIRQGNSPYVSKNNYHCDDLLKYKRFEDEEWQVTGAEECNGSHKGAIKWLCEKNINGQIFKLTAKQMGSVEDSKNLYSMYLKNPKKFIGKMINIRFNDRTKDGIPRFPRATVFPEDK